MATRKLSDVLKSGEIADIRLSNNIWFEQADVVEADGMFMRVGLGGGVSLYKAPDQDVHWEDTDNTSQSLPETSTEVLVVAVNEDVTTEDGSWNISMRFDNTANKDRTVLLNVKVNGTVSSMVSYDLKKHEIDRQVLLGGTLKNNILANDIISVELDASDTGVELRGDLFSTRLKVTKAQAAAV